MTGAAGYEDLVTAATVGLDRRPLPVEALAGPAGAHAGVLDAGDPVAAFLDAAALLFSARRAGPVPAAADSGPAGLAPAAPDTAPELNARAAAVLGYVLRGGDPDLLADLLTAAAAAGFRAPAPMLPGLLDAAARHRALREPVTAVLGARGRWLAAFHPDWQRVADTATATARPELDLDDESVWLTGRRAERRDWLAALRATDPAAARERLAAGWARETGDDRAGLLGVLAAGLSAADEPFLEAALDDRKQSVREAAARLLGTLGESDFTRRAIARGTATLALEQQGPRPALIVSLPESGDAAAARDGISATRPSQAVGTRAWLLTQLDRGGAAGRVDEQARPRPGRAGPAAGLRRVPGRRARGLAAGRRGPARPGLGRGAAAGPVRRRGGPAAGDLAGPGRAGRGAAARGPAGARGSVPGRPRAEPGGRRGAGRRCPARGPRACPTPCWSSWPAASGRPAGRAGSAGC